jgi:Xaa-Pro aminopeptidase
MSRRLLSVFAVLVVFVFAPSRTQAQDPQMPAILSMEERAEVVNRWLEIRFDTVIPMLMRRANIDMWVVSAREYNEDPIIETMLPATWQSARRRTILVFYDRGPEEGVERLAIARYDIGDFFASAWDKEEQPDQWARLAEVIEERDPQQIALNRSETFGLADGMTDTEFDGMLAALPSMYQERIVSGEGLAIGWLETRTPEEMAVYPMIVRMAHAIIAEGFSEAVIQPGVTTTEDVQWWYRDRIRDLNLTAWFHPSVSVQRPESGEAGDFSSRPEASVIQPGDLLHVDFGITYLRLNTDTQQHAYVLKPGETEAPAGLRDGLATGNRLQNILTNQFETGRTGNEILAAALSQAESEGIDATIYTHPIGFHGHGAGPTIGLWDQQGGVPGKGDYPLYANTAYSIELNAAVSVPEWDGQEILIKLEEDAFFDGETVGYIDGRQKELHLIPRQHGQPYAPLLPITNEPASGY